MKAFRLICLSFCLLTVASGLLLAQTPPLQDDAVGFSYTLPPDWQVVVPSSPPPQQPKPSQNTPQEVKKGLACVEVPITARHGTPPSVLVVIALPFDCFGQTMAQQDLAGFGFGVTEGLKTTFDFLNPVTTTYTLAGHRLWMERVKAVPRGKTAPVDTVEIACAILQKGSVCWMVDAADAASLAAFEHAAVTLEGSTPAPLVPPEVFLKSFAPTPE